MHRRLWTSVLASLGLIVLIIDAKTALHGAAQGIELCTKAVVPSLFPFFIMSILLTSALTGQKLRILQPIGRLCGMPSGSESLLLVGLLGGYPSGAQAVTQAYANGQIRKKDAQRLLGFCSNAGPAFLFGMVSMHFPSVRYVWALWGIHILSAVMVGVLLPGKSKVGAQTCVCDPITIPSALGQSVKIMASVCAWVILFRVMIFFADRWFLWLLPEPVKTIFIGVLELSNGCCELSLIQDVSLRFIVCSGILAFGGLCVTMQTVSVAKELGMGMYFPGKALQCLISLVLSSLVILLGGDNRFGFLVVTLIFGAIFVLILLLLRKMQKKSSNIRPVSV